MSRGRTILYLNEFFHPDVCASAAVLADQLPAVATLRPDWQLIVAAGNRAWDDPAVIYPSVDEFRGVGVLRVDRPAVDRTNLLRRGWGFVKFGSGVMSLARRLDRIDLVVGTTAPPHGGFLARRIAKRSRCPYIYRVLDLYPELTVTLGKSATTKFTYRRWLAQDQTIMRDAAMILTVTEPMSERIRRTRAVPADRVRTLYDGLDPARVQPSASNMFKARMNPQGRFVVQYAGNMGLSHPFEAIADAVRTLASEGDTLFQFIGDGPRRAFLAERLPPSTQLLPYQPAAALGDVLETADLFLITQEASMFDQAIPFKIYSCLCAGRPTIFVGSGESEIAKWLTEAGAGVQVEQDDTAGLIRVIRDLRGDAGRRDKMGQAARTLFEKRFQVCRVAEAWVNAMEEAMANTKGCGTEGLRD